MVAAHLIGRKALLGWGRTMTHAPHAIAGGA
ncbi:hypothetical protein C404_19015 [Ralstonia sp. AU12-08]|nr:hypothetical protein C404_19015 [Ralstonia sp. AU12-08]